MKLILALVILLFPRSIFPAQKDAPRLLLRVDQMVSGPFGGEKSLECLRVYSDGKVSYARWQRAGIVIVDKETGQSSRPEKTVSFEYAIPDRDAWELQELRDFIQSKAVRGLKDSFGPPHTPIDYFENTKVEILLQDGRSKHISTREYYVASYMEKAKYPSALIILMDQINHMESQVEEKGKSSSPPSDCVLHE
jgi:hypothetical protein